MCTFREREREAGYKYFPMVTGGNFRMLTLWSFCM